MEPDVKSIYDMTPGAVFGGRYRVVAPHRRGGLSAAFEVVDGESGRTCELQFFPAGLFELGEQAEEFRSSIQPWQEVRSEYVLRVHDMVPLGDGGLVLVTDLPRGATLRTRLNREKRLEAEEAIRLGLHILDGLEAIHSRSLVHGDVKPFTIHLQERDDELVPLLVDGGLTLGLWTAKGLGDRTALIGTPYYAPVEQFGGEAPDVRSDLYNVSTVLFECLTGKLPWAGTSFLEVFQAKLDRSPPSMRKRAPQVQVNPAIERVIVRGCLADRNERPATVEEFRDALAQLV